MVLDGHGDVLVVHVEEAGEDLLRVQAGKLGLFEVVDLKLAENGRHELVVQKLRVCLLVGDATLDVGFEGVLELVELAFVELHGRRVLNIVGLEPAEAVEDEVEALRVLRCQEGVDDFRRDATTSALVVLVELVDDREHVVVDVEVVVLLDVLGEVRREDPASDLAENALGPVSDRHEARKHGDELASATLRLSLEVAEAGVAGATEERHLADELRVENLEARIL